MREETSFATVQRIIRQVLGDAFGAGVEITLETSFWRDLEIESIELVTLGEALQLEYGEAVDFVTWLSGQDLTAMTELKVGDLVRFIDEAVGQGG